MMFSTIKFYDIIQNGEKVTHHDAYFYDSETEAMMKFYKVLAADPVEGQKSLLCMVITDTGSVSARQKLLY